MNKEDILVYLRSIKYELNQYGISKIGLFGSFARDQADLNSDIDIVINTTPQFVKSFDGVTGFLFLEDLRKRLENQFHRPVDICDEAGLKHSSTIEGSIYA